MIEEDIHTSWVCVQLLQLKKKSVYKRIAINEKLII